MAAENKAGNAPVEAAALPDAVPFDQRPPLHKAFEWSDPSACDFIPAHAPIAFFNMTRDITQGAVTALGIIDRCQMDAEDDDTDGCRPLLSQHDQASLMRLTIGALRALNGVAEDHNEWVDKYGPQWKAREMQERQKSGHLVQGDDA